jgi:endonuclease G
MMKTAFLRVLKCCGPVVGALLAVSVHPSAGNPVDLSNLTNEQKGLLEEHVFGGTPSKDNIYIRNGYILCFNPTTKTPTWVAYHVKPDYRETPNRKGRFKTFRNDPDIVGEAKDADYKGLFTSRGFARGHLAPYAVMGGDRDGDGKYAEEDEDDALTVFQSNYMSNIAPQHHTAFNGAPGLWWRLERWVQDDLVRKQGKEVWVFAGCIFGSGEHEKVGKNNDIWVPPMFFKIVAMENPDIGVPIVLAFLFPHQRSAHGSIDNFLVTVDVIEALTGVDFFNELEDQTEKWLEDQDTWEVWKRRFASND